MSKLAASSAQTHAAAQPPRPAVGLFGQRWQVHINAAYLTAYPLETFSDYNAFTSQHGTLIKNETRTMIIRVNDAPVRIHPDAVSFVLKVYRYPLPAGLRTWSIRSKAEREFQGLALLKQWGIPAVEAVACGTRRSAFGMVESCFVLTRLESRTISLRDWLKAGGAATTEGTDRVKMLLHEIGASLRTSHSMRFFLYASAAKDILVRDDGSGPLAWCFIDLPYSRYLTPNYLARLGQRRDIGALAGSVIKYVGVDVFESFYSSYLTDPLGAPEASLRKRVLRGGKIHNHDSPITQIRRGLNRRLRKTGRTVTPSEERR